MVLSVKPKRSPYAALVLAGVERVTSAELPVGCRDIRQLQMRMLASARFYGVRLRTQVLGDVLECEYLPGGTPVGSKGPAVQVEAVPRPGGSRHAAVAVADDDF